MAIKRCLKCQGGVEPIRRFNEVQFYFCRACKIPYNESGRVIVDLASMSSSFNPLRLARGIIGRAHPDMAPVARTALEVLLIQGFQECYLEGLKSGVLLAYSQDVDSGSPTDGSKRPTNAV